MRIVVQPETALWHFVAEKRGKWFQGLLGTKPHVFLQCGTAVERSEVRRAMKLGFGVTGAVGRLIDFR